MKIVLFDGECTVCNKSVQFIIKRDPRAFFHFASLQSEVAQKLLQSHTIKQDIDSIILIDSHKLYTKSTAALKISKDLSGLWRLLYVLIIVPKPIRDLIYTTFAKNRHRFFKHQTTCIIPDENIRKRFLTK